LPLAYLQEDHGTVRRASEGDAVFPRRRAGMVNLPDLQEDHGEMAPPAKMSKKMAQDRGQFCKLGDTPRRPRQRYASSWNDALGHRTEDHG